MKCYPAIFIVSICLFISCKKAKEAQYSHPEYFNKVLTEAENISGTFPEKTMAFIDSCYNAFPAPGIKDLYRKYAFKCAFFSDVTRNDSIALAYTDSMLQVLHGHTKEHVFIEDYANALFKKGNLLLWQRDYAGSFDCNFKARQAIEPLKDPCLISSYTGTLAVVSYKEGKFLSAAHYMQQAINEMRSCPGDYHKFKAIQGKYDDIGLSYMHCGMNDSALFYYKTAIEYLEKYKDSFPNIKSSPQFVRIALGVVYGNMGDIYLKKGDTATAEQFYRKDVAINAQQGGDPGDGVCTQAKLINLYLCLNKTSDAKAVLDDMQKLVTENPTDKESAFRWYQAQIDYLVKTGQTNETYKYIKPFLHLKDSLINVRQIPQVDVQEEYAHIQDQYDLVLAENANKQKTLILIIVLCCSVLPVIIAWLFWRIWKRTKQLNAHVSQQNREMQMALSSLTESQKENTNMMQIVAHDLRNPIASMISITHLLLDNDKLEPDDREMLELMNKSSLHAIEMIGDLLNVNTTAEGMNKEQVDIQTLLGYCVDLLQFKATEKQQHISLDAETAMLSINREKIWRVLSNIIVNAIKFSPEGGSIQVTGSVLSGMYNISIKDNGIGIPDKIKPRVFDMFTEAKRPGTSGEKSFGLGLAISRQIIAAHGGKIWFDSESEVGTTFYISIPAE